MRASPAVACRNSCRSGRPSRSLRGGFLRGVMKKLLIGVSCAAVAVVTVSVHYGWRPLFAQASPKAHWEPYRAQHPKPSVDQQLTDPALIGAIDLHAHYGPDSYARQWDAF